MNSEMAIYVLFGAGFAMLVFGAASWADNIKPVDLILFALGILHMLPLLIRLWIAAIVG